MVIKTDNMELISRIFNHPKVYNMISDDCSIPPYVPDPKNLYIINEEETGVCLILPFTGTSCITHMAFLPAAWGRTAGFVKEGADWIFNNTHYTKIVSMAPEFNRLVIRLGKKCGFKIEGRITKSFLKNWKLHDLIIFGLSKYDVKEE